MKEGKYNLLTIEDDPDIQTIIRMSLKMDGRFDVSCASNGADGARMAKEYLPEVILLDYSLPDMLAPEVIALLRAEPRTVDIPIVLLTARTDGFQESDGFVKELKGVLIKPFLPAEVGGKIIALLNPSPLT